MYIYLHSFVILSLCHANGYVITNINKTFWRLSPNTANSMEYKNITAESHSLCLTKLTVTLLPICYNNSNLFHMQVLHPFESVARQVTARHHCHIQAKQWVASLAGLVTTSLCPLLSCWPVPMKNMLCYVYTCVYQPLVITVLNDRDESLKCQIHIPYWCI